MKIMFIIFFIGIFCFAQEININIRVRGYYNPGKAQYDLRIDEDLAKKLKVIPGDVVTLEIDGSSTVLLLEEHYEYKWEETSSGKFSSTKIFKNQPHSYIIRAFLSNKSIALIIKVDGQTLILEQTPKVHKFKMINFPDLI